MQHLPTHRPSSRSRFLNPQGMNTGRKFTCPGVYPFGGGLFFSLPETFVSLCFFQLLCSLEVAVALLFSPRPSAGRLSSFGTVPPTCLSAGTVALPQVVNSIFLGRPQFYGFVFWPVFYAFVVSGDYSFKESFFLSSRCFRARGSYRLFIPPFPPALAAAPVLPPPCRFSRGEGCLWSYPPLLFGLELPPLVHKMVSGWLFLVWGLSLGKVSVVSATKTSAPPLFLSFGP